MIQFNLLPDIKLQYIRSARTKRLVIGISSLVSLVVIVVVTFISFYTFIVRGNHLRNISNDVSARTGELTNTEDIDKILTIQNQLTSLTALHERKPEASRLYTYLTQLTPEGISLSTLSISFVESTITVSGQASSLSQVNQYVDTFKFTDYKTTSSTEDIEPAMLTEDSELTRAFSEVVLSGFEVGTEVNFGIELKYDPLLFDDTAEVELVIPSQFTTRSQTEKPLFDTQQKDGEEQ